MKKQQRNVNTAGGAYFEGSIHAEGDVVGGDKVTVGQGVAGEDLVALFDAIYRRIDQRPEVPDIDRAELKETVQRVQEEVGKGEQANTGKIARWLRTLADVAPDIFKVTAAALANPLAGVVAAVQAVAVRLEREVGP
jgi:hypothetical protein